jgi:SNF2 family DNA or RNA helicase
MQHEEAMSLFKEDNTLYPFQADHIALAYPKPVTMLVWDTGTGKSIGAMALACLALEEGGFERVVLVCEANKLVHEEWPATIEKFTEIDWALYHGTLKKREKIRANLPTLLLTSFDIIKRDAAIFPAKKNSRSVPTPGPLLDVLAGQKVLVIIDETTRIANRTSGNHKAMKLFIETLMAEAECKVLAMTATPMERDPSSLYDLGRILTPGTMPTVSEFEHDYVAQWDIFRKPMRYKNLTPANCAKGVEPFNERFNDILLRKRKTDPDVVNFFPKRREMPPTFVRLGKAHQQFYDTVQAIGESVPEFEQRKYVTVLRQIAAHPMSLTLAEGEIARAIVDYVSPDGLAAMGSAKTDRMVEWLRTVVDEQGEQAVVFTYFASTVLPLLTAAAEGTGWSYSVNHGGLSLPARSAAQRAFRSGETQIFFTSDAGAKGINLPEAAYLLHYERPPLHSLLVQRADRIHRIDSTKESVWMDSLVARDTIEEGLYNLNLRRNDWSDKLLGDDEAAEMEFISAADRRDLLRIGKAT